MSATENQFIPSASKNIERYTPPSIFKGLGIRFDLDPCAPVEWCPSHDWCDRLYHSNGLSRKWCGRVWLNPPWVRGEKRKWVARLREHGDGIALVRAGIDSAWLHDNFPDAIYLLRGRVKYLRSDAEKERDRKGGAVGGLEPSILIAFGDECVDALKGADLPGYCVVPPPSPRRSGGGS